MTCYSRLELAIKNNNLGMVKIIFKELNIKDTSFECDLYNISNKEIFDFVVTKNVLTFESYNQILSYNASNNLDFFETLLFEYNLNPIFGNHTLLKSHSRDGNYEVVKILLKDSRINAAINRNESIELAISNGHKKTALLLSKNNNVIYSEDIHRALRIAFVDKMEEVCNELWQHSYVRENLKYNNIKLYNKIKLVQNISAF
jgi:hypothetical protein